MKNMDEASFKTATYLFGLMLDGTLPKPNQSAEKGIPWRCAYLGRHELLDLMGGAWVEYRVGFR
jgi:hypothetical protein